MHTVNDEGLVGLRFGEFGILCYFCQALLAKDQSTYVLHKWNYYQVECLAI